MSLQNTRFVNCNEYSTRKAFAEEIEHRLSRLEELHADTAPGNLICHTHVKEKPLNVDKDGHPLEKGCLVKAVDPDQFGIFDYAVKSGLAKYVNIYGIWQQPDGTWKTQWRGQEFITFVCTLPHCGDC